MSRDITSAVSQLFGKFASKEFAKPIQKFINSSYVNIMGLDMSEFSSPETYSTLNALFTRKLREDRAYSLDGGDFISPCDSFITECGDLQEEYALQIKGMKYKTDELIGEHFTKEEREIVSNGTFINFYLSPKDYHRYHIPTNIKVLKTAHIPGKFYPVNIPSLKKRINLFVENERVVILCETTTKKRFYMVLVSALNVGVMQVSFEPKIKTNADAENSTLYSYEELYLNKGDDFGCFEMGSTIVILAQHNMLELGIKADEHVRYGDTIAKLK
ncbi:MAG: phosphatidylserine decarboxylase [Sulfurimonas sp.]|uniref:phosphatidylserine decarboxylase n=1 Tax=Sulfurimonas sp. TaxID=2022749 RepID=UPI0025E9F2D7|nr:phosphatidylserine decarboxylase [Sulfurimonas sp.]MCK9453627.1 phosphatidylserine decarboxylase [Sulfurimonas sp.]